MHTVVPSSTGPFAHVCRQVVDQGRIYQMGRKTSQVGHQKGRDRVRAFGSSSPRLLINLDRELRNSIDTLRLETDEQAGFHSQLAQRIRADLADQGRVQGQTDRGATSQQSARKARVGLSTH